LISGLISAAFGLLPSVAPGQSHEGYLDDKLADLRRPYGAGSLLFAPFPTLKRGANHHCASGAIEIRMSLGHNIEIGMSRVNNIEIRMNLVNNIEIRMNLVNDIEIGMSLGQNIEIRMRRVNNLDSCDCPVRRCGTDAPGKRRYVS